MCHHEMHLWEKGCAYIGNACSAHFSWERKIYLIRTTSGNKGEEG